MPCDYIIYSNSRKKEMMDAYVVIQLLRFFLFSSYWWARIFLTGFYGILDDGELFFIFGNEEPMFGCLIRWLLLFVRINDGGDYVA